MESLSHIGPDSDECFKLRSESAFLAGLRHAAFATLVPLADGKQSRHRNVARVEADPEQTSAHGTMNDSSAPHVGHRWTIADSPKADEALEGLVGRDVHSWTRAFLR